MNAGYPASAWGTGRRNTISAVIEQNDVEPGLAQDPRAPRADRIRRLITPAVVLAIAALAFVARLVLMLRGGGLLASSAYDDGVYYTAAVALVHGRLPYHDFLFLQPPAILLALAPFAWLGSLIGDHRGLELARLAFMMVGAVNTALITVAARRYGWVAAVVGGVSYAIFFPAVYSERSTLIEPLGTTGILLAVLLGHRHWRRPWLGGLLAGLLAGAAVGFKAWYIVPLVVVFAFQRRGRLMFLLGAAAAGVLVYVPFLLAAPGPMVQQVVLNQLGRPRPGTLIGNLRKRLLAFSGVWPVPEPGAPSLLSPNKIAAVVLLVALILAIAACTVRGARIWPVLTAAAAVVLLASPSFFGHYVVLIAPPAAVTVGIGAGRLAGFLPRPAFRGIAAAVLVGLVALISIPHDLKSHVGVSIPVSALRPAAARVQGCVMTDDPVIVVALDTLSRDLSRGCPFWPDVTGWTYDRDDVKVNGVELSRPENERWQRDVLAYLRSGDAAIVHRKLTGLNADTKAVLAQGPVLARHGSWVLHGTP